MPAIMKAMKGQTVACAVMLVVFLVEHSNAQATAQFTRFASHHIPGHDEGGIYTLDHEHVDDAEACAQLCLNDRGCNSFEFGTSAGNASSDCLLSYDTRATVGTNSLVASANFDFYERTAPINPVGFYARIADTWIPGVNDVATYEEVTVTACAQLCFHHPECGSFEHSDSGPACLDSVHSGFTLRYNNGTSFEASCVQLAQLNFCNHVDHGETISSRCPASCDFCQDPRSMCQLSYYVNGDTHADGSLIESAPLQNWSLYTKAAPTTAACSAGSTSFTGVTAQSCEQCPANTFSSSTETRCIPCPDDYTSPAGSSSIHNCTRSISTSNDTSVFQEGQLWVGSYFCGANFSGQGNGKLELLVTEIGNDDAITFVRRFQNSFSRGSYYMSMPSMPAFNSSFTINAGEWIDQPPNSTTFNGAIRYTITTDITGTVTNESGTVRFTGNMCDGTFGLSLTCDASGNETFEVGEQWIGEYVCQDTVESDRTDVRRLDLTIAETNDTHVRVINHFFHQDGAGSFMLEGDFNESNYRLHLATNGNDAWIRRPSLNWYTSDLNGAITDDKLLFYGTKGNDPACGCTGEMRSVTAYDALTQGLLTRQVGGVCQGFEPVPCTTPAAIAAQNISECWQLRRPWCYTNDECPNGEVHASTGLQAVSCLVQTCSRFQAHRVCAPLDMGMSCDCTGQNDTLGRGSTCSSYPDDSRGNWCYVSSRCVSAGPGDPTVAPGLFWSSCNPVQPCLQSEWSDFSACNVSGCSGAGTDTNGTRARTRTTLRFPTNGGTQCGPNVQVENCTTVCPATGSPTTPGPSVSPSTSDPTESPTSSSPSSAPSTPTPTIAPSASPATSTPSIAPSTSTPSISPTGNPTESPQTQEPTGTPTSAPSAPTVAPTFAPSSPTLSPTTSPTTLPSMLPTVSPTSSAPTPSIPSVGGNCSDAETAACSGAPCIVTGTGPACFCGNGTAILSGNGVCDDQTAPVCSFNPCNASQLCVSNNAPFHGFSCEDRGSVVATRPVGVTEDDTTLASIKDAIEELLEGRRRTTEFGTVIVAWVNGNEVDLDVVASALPIVLAALNGCTLCFDDSAGGRFCLHSQGSTPCPVPTQSTTTSFDDASPLGSDSNDSSASTTTTIVVVVVLLLLCILIAIGFVLRKWAVATSDNVATREQFENPVYDSNGNSEGLYATVNHPSASDPNYQDVNPTQGFSNPLYAGGGEPPSAGYSDILPPPNPYLDVKPGGASSPRGPYLDVHPHDNMYALASDDAAYLDTRPQPGVVETGTGYLDICSDEDPCDAPLGDGLYDSVGNDLGNRANSLVNPTYSSVEKC